jgi:benzoylformate decarboxylase
MTTSVTTRTETVSCAEATLRTLVDVGAEVWFNLPGRGIYPLLNELPKVPSLRYVTAVHEFALAAMADGYARATGRVGHLSLYMSSGSLNASSMLFLARRDRIPILVTATQTESWAVGAGARAESEDILGTMRGIVKWAAQPPSPDRVAETLRRAYTIAASPPMGPAFVAIPVDYWGREVSYEQWRPQAVARAHGDAGLELDGVVETLRAAARPAVVVGAEAIAAGAAERIEVLARTIGAPVLAEPDGARIPLPTEHALFAGFVDDTHDPVSDADVILHVGVNSYSPEHRSIFSPSATHIWVGSDPGEANKVVLSTVQAIGDLRGIMEAIYDAVAGLTSDAAESARLSEVKSRIQGRRQAWKDLFAPDWDARPMSVARALSELSLAVPDDVLVIDQSTTATSHLRQFLPIRRTDGYLAASGSSQGWALGAAVGAGVGLDGRTVVCVTGDGGLMFGMQALWSLAQYQPPVLLVLLNNGGWNSMRNSVDRGAPAAKGMVDRNYGWSVDYCAMAGSMGIEGRTITEPGEFSEILGAALPLSSPLLLDVRVRREAAGLQPGK